MKIDMVMFKKFLNTMDKRIKKEHGDKFSISVFNYKDKKTAVQTLNDNKAFRCFVNYFDENIKDYISCAAIHLVKNKKHITCKLYTINEYFEERAWIVDYTWIISKFI